MVLRDLSRAIPYRLGKNVPRSKGYFCPSSELISVFELLSAEIMHMLPRILAETI